MKKIFKGFALAINMLTIFPFFTIHDFYKGINGYSVMFYPLVGFIIGLFLALFYTLLIHYFPPLHVSLIILALWAIFTGALHLDGLSDSIDGFFVPKERALEVMKDPNVGAMGMIFTVLFILLKGSALLHVSTLFQLPLILMLARYNTVLAIYFYPYLSKNGMGALAKEEFTAKQLLFSSLIILIFVSLTPDGWILLLASLLSLGVIQYFFIKRYGGFSGDMYGFTIEMSELILLHAMIFGIAL